MGVRRGPGRLAAGELELLEVLWRIGPATLAEAHAALPRQVGYTTVQTRLNRMADKGLVGRSAERPAQYSAAVSRQDVSQEDLQTLVRQVSGGQIVPLVAQLVRDSQLSPAEIQELRQLIDDAERQGRKRASKKERGR